MKRVKVVFVCLGNICRSPTAEGVFRHLVSEQGLDDHLLIDSAGTGAWHVGEAPDRRSTRTALERGVTLEGAARKATPKDFERFDYVLAMDAENHDTLARMAKTAAAKKKLHMFRDFDEGSPNGSEVPDPYYGGGNGFERVFDICQAASEGLLAFLRREHDF